MNQEARYKLFWIPILIIGATLILLGPGWMISEEPWLLDQVANEETLGKSFDELFSKEINNTLPEYLRTIYRFFGLWVTTLGVIFCSQVLVIDLRKKKPRLVLLAILGALLMTSLVLGYTRIPNSPFIYLMWIYVVLLAVSIFASFNLTDRSEDYDSTT